MADISFLLLAFFLMVSDIKTDKGIARVLPPIPKENAEKPEIHQRNIFQYRAAARLYVQKSVSCVGRII